MTYTKETHTKTSKHRGPWGRGEYWEGWRQSGPTTRPVPWDTQFSAWHPWSALPSCPSLSHTSPCVKSVPFSIYYLLWPQERRGQWKSRRQETPPRPRERHPVPFQHWRGDKTIPWPKQDLISPPQERGPHPMPLEENLVNFFFFGLLWPSIHPIPNWASNAMTPEV